MGRFFQAQPVELNRDFIYQPPLELMAKALLKKDDDIQQQADTMELMRSLPIDFIDYHKDGAANIKKEINSDIDNLAKEIMTKGALDGSLKAKINAYKNQLQERYSTGDIYNIQQTKKNYEEFEKKLEATKGLTSAQKEKHKQEYWNNYTKENPDGGYKSVYTPGVIIDDVDYLGEYSDWFNKLKPDQKKNIIQKLGGRYDTMTETERNGLILENGHEIFLQARPDLQELLKQQGQSNIFRDRDIRFNEDGNLNYKEGFLGNLGKAAKEMNYTQNSDSKTYNVNQYAYRQEGWAYEASKGLEEKKAELGTLTYETAARTAEQLKIINEDYHNNIRSLAKELGLQPIDIGDNKKGDNKKGYTKQQIENRLIELENKAKTNNDTTLLNILSKKRKALDTEDFQFRTKSSQASWAGAAALLGPEKALQIKKEYESRFNDTKSINNKPMEQWTINGKKYVSIKDKKTKVERPITYNDILTYPEMFGIKKEIFYDTDGSLNEGLSRTYNKNSAIPAVYDANNMNNNDMLFDFNLENISISAKASFTKLGITD